MFAILYDPPGTEGNPREYELEVHNDIQVSSFSIAGSMANYKNLLIKGNVTLRLGGGVQVFPTQTVTIDGPALICTGSSAYAFFRISNNGTFIMKGNASLSGNKTTQYDGGGVYVGTGGRFIMQGNSSVHDNELRNASSKGCGVFVAAGGTFIMEDDSSVYGNTTFYPNGGNGGGVYIDGSGHLTMSGNASIHDNGPVPIGGGVNIVANGALTMKDYASIYDNASTVSGGGVHAGNSAATITMQDHASIYGNICENTSNGNPAGGGVYIGGTFTMKNYASVHDNELTAANGISYGGGVYVTGDDNSFTMLDNASVYGNTAKSERTYEALGGGVYIYGATFTLRDNSSVYGNTAHSWQYYARGGGVFVRRTTIIMRENASIYGNTVNGYSGSALTNGGGVYLDIYGYLRIEGGIITGRDGYGDFGSNRIMEDYTVTPFARGFALYAGGDAAQYGVFNGTAWTSYGTLSSPTYTVRVVNGVLQE
jgi:hypothetical protein